MNVQRKSRRAFSGGGPAARDWTVRIQPAGLDPFEFKATFEKSGTSRGVLDARYLYGDGDLAVFLEDLGAGTPAIRRVLKSLHGNDQAEISIDITEEAMEVLVRAERA
jgi:hypothetical protein